MILRNIGIGLTGLEVTKLREDHHQDRLPLAASLSEAVAFA